jgi:hypothetical protein
MSHIFFLLTGPDMYNLVPLVEAYVGGSVMVWPRVVLHFLFTLPPLPLPHRPSQPFLW